MVMKKFLSPFLLLVMFGLGLFLWWSNASKAPNPQDKTTKDFLIVKGEAAFKVAKKLEDAGFIKDELAFRLYTQGTGQEKKIQAGSYELSPSMTLKEIVSTLTKGPIEIWVTYPEGLRREEMAIKTIKLLGLETDKADAFWEEFINSSQDKEGFLFPDTYLFSKDITARKVVGKLNSTFDQKITDEMISDSKKTGLVFNEVITLASILERETRTDEERPIVAGILLKRLDAGWPLQADATLQYLVGSQKCGGEDLKSVLDCPFWQVPTVEDKKIKSGFNTYQNRGLPPRPIASPGLSSIKAVIYPQESPYWFYLHDKEGKIRYAKTDEKHAENISRYLK